LPARGLSVDAPNPATVMSGGASELEFLRKNVPVAGLYNPIVAVPSPFQSPTSGVHPASGGPYANEMSATPVEFEFLKKNVLVMPYDPHNRKYLPREENPLPQELEDRIVRDTLLLNEVLGYDLNTVEFAMRDGIPYAIDFMNPAPDADIWSVTEPYFGWIVESVAKMLVDYAKHSTPTARYHRWNRLLNQDGAQDFPAVAGALAHDIVKGVEQVAQSASDMISEAIEQITEPVKARKARKATEGARTTRPRSTKKAGDK